MDKHIVEPWQHGVSGDGATARSRVWAHMPGVGGVIIADFGPSDVLRSETKKANAHRAALCVNFCAGLSNEDIERLMTLTDTP